MVRVLKAQDFAPVPKSKKNRSYDAMSDGRERPAEGKGTDPPNQKGIGIVLINIIDLGNKPYACSEKHSPQYVQGFAYCCEPAPRPSEIKAETVGSQKREEHQCEFYGLMQFFPVIGEKEDDPQAKKDSSYGRENYPAPENTLLRFRIEVFNGFSLFSVDDARKDPFFCLIKKPFYVFAHRISDWPLIIKL
jgi:hypothetical protein